MKKNITILVFIIFTAITSGQTVFVPLNNDIYNYLERLSIKKLISINDEARPFSRKYVALLLAELKNKSSRLNKVELDELEWYIEEYATEYGNAGKSERWYLFSYKDSLFNVKVLPDFGYGLSRTGEKSGFIKWPGITMWGTYSDWFGASFSYVDVGEFGSNIDAEKKYSPKTGAFFKDAPGGIETSDVNGSITFDWQWGNVSLIKDYIQWGHGKFGQVTLSNKAPSFPHIRLSLNPAKWLRFNYIHGWLSSLVQDSANFYYNHLESKSPFLRKKNINKYIAANMLTISPFDWADISIGNSFIYSGDLRPEMFIPFLYYKVMDHITGREDIEDGNGAIFFDYKVNYIKDFSLYGSVFMDVIEIREIIKNNWGTSWFGYTTGLKKTDLIVNNLDLTVEYTKTNPWVYEHKDQSTTYKNYNYSLGHWIGQNADYIRFQLDYQPIRGLQTSFFADRMRKGGLKDIYYAYKEIKTLPFLYGEQKKDYSIGFEGSYEIIHGLRFSMSYRYSDVSDEQADRTQEFLLGKKNSLGVLIHYGL